MADADPEAPKCAQPCWAAGCPVRGDDLKQREVAWITHICACTELCHSLTFLTWMKLYFKIWARA